MILSSVSVYCAVMNVFDEPLAFNTKPLARHGARHRIDIIIIYFVYSISNFFC
jgi:hypothetical protein